MDIKKLDRVAEYYSTEGSAYKRDASLAREGKEVYVSETDPDKRLRFKMQPSGSVIASLMNAKGEIRSWDTYNISSNYPESHCVTHAAEGERRAISFDDKDLQDMVRQFGETGKADTIQHLERVIPLVRDPQAKDILITTKNKLDALSERDCADLIAYIKKRKDVEHGYSLRVRLKRAQAQVKARDAERRQRAQFGRQI